MERMQADRTWKTKLLKFRRQRILSTPNIYFYSTKYTSGCSDWSPLDLSLKIRYQWRVDVSMHEITRVEVCCKLQLQKKQLFREEGGRGEGHQCGVQYRVYIRAGRDAKTRGRGDSSPYDRGIIAVAPRGKTRVRVPLSPNWMKMHILLSLPDKPQVPNPGPAYAATGISAIPGKQPQVAFNCFAPR